jgi:enoyl-CoA hydratase/carnithine racemase
VLVVTGARPSFCAGADISSLSEDEAVLKSVVEAAERALRGSAMPTIAKVCGPCLGGGNQIAVACDLCVADSTASFGVPPARLGVVYPVGSTRALVELVGPASGSSAPTAASMRPTRQSPHLAHPVRPPSWRRA